MVLVMKVMHGAMHSLVGHLTGHKLVNDGMENKPDRGTMSVLFLFAFSLIHSQGIN